MPILVVVWCTRLFICPVGSAFSIISFMFYNDLKKVLWSLDFGFLVKLSGNIFLSEGLIGLLLSSFDN